MTFEELKKLIAYCKALDIQTMGQLAKWKTERDIADNNELISTLYEEAKTIKLIK